jgi:exosortase
MLPVILLPPLFWIAYAARLAELRSITSITFILTLLIATFFVYGGRRGILFAPAILYLIFALPFWSFIINNYTNPLQIYSTKVALKMLEMFYDPIQSNSTTILVGHFWLDVGVPCSGLKLVLAITAFTCFFMLIGGLKWWGNLVMVLFILPLCLFINGLRIALIGMVGEAYGDQAGHTFHDYSGYLTLIVCFFILFKLARVLGWKG